MTDPMNTSEPKAGALDAAKFRLEDEYDRFADALAGVPDVAERRAKGQQFNAYDLDDDGERKVVCIGPITSRPLSLVEAPADVADLLEAALRLASDTSFSRPHVPAHSADAGDVGKGGEDADLFERLDAIMVEQSPMHPFGCATWEEETRIAIDMAKDRIAALRPSAGAGGDLRYTGRKHDLKCWPEPFAALRAGLKRFEFRRNDRDYQVGDLLWNREWDPAMEDYTGEATGNLVTWMICGPAFGIPDGYCIMSLDDNPALTATEAKPEGEGVELTFGMGALVVNTGTFGGDNAVFIAKAIEPGEVGAYTGKSAFKRDVLQPGENGAVNFAPIIKTLRKGVIRKSGKGGVRVDIEATDVFMASVADILEAVVKAGRSSVDPESLAALIQKEFLGVRPDDQGFVLEDDDWRAILAALASSNKRRIDSLSQSLREVIPGVKAYLLTGDAMSQGLKKRVWSPILSRARQALQSIGSGE